MTLIVAGCVTSQTTVCRFAVLSYTPTSFKVCDTVFELAAMPSAAVRPSSGGLGLPALSHNTGIFSDIPLPVPGFSRPASAASLPSSLQRQEVVEAVQRQLMEAEDSVPWTAVRKHWKGKRNAWRKAVRHAASVPELGKCIKELKAAFCNDSNAAVECSATWQESLEDCCQGSGSHLLLHGVWGELQPKIFDWLQSRNSPRKAAAASVQDSVQRGISAMQQVFHNSGGSADAMAQVPLEQICNYEADTAKAIRDKLCKERRALLASSNSTPFLLAVNIAANERTIGTDWAFRPWAFRAVSNIRRSSRSVGNIRICSLGFVARGANEMRRLH